MDRETIQMLKQKYTPGIKVRLVHMDDAQAPQPGTTGEVTHVDDIGTIFVAWSNGSHLGLIYGVDSFELY